MNRWALPRVAPPASSGWGANGMRCLKPIGHGMTAWVSLLRRRRSLGGRDHPIGCALLAVGVRGDDAWDRFGGSLPQSLFMQPFGRSICILTRGKPQSAQWRTRNRGGVMPNVTRDSRQSLSRMRKGKYSVVGGKGRNRRQPEPGEQKQARRATTCLASQIMKPAAGRVASEERVALSMGEILMAAHRQHTLARPIAPKSYLYFGMLLMVWDRVSDHGHRSSKSRALFLLTGKEPEFMSGVSTTQGSVVERGRSVSQLRNAHSRKHGYPSLMQAVKKEEWQRDNGRKTRGEKKNKGRDF